MRLLGRTSSYNLASGQEYSMKKAKGQRQVIWPLGKKHRNNEQGKTEGMQKSKGGSGQERGS